MTLSTFKDLIVWQRARTVVVQIYRLASSGRISRDHGFRSQIQRAAVSIMANIAEGSERDSLREFAYLLRVAKASAGELRSHVILAGDLGFFPQEDIHRLEDDLVQIGSMLTALIKRQIERSGSVRKRETPGHRPGVSQ